MITFNFYLCLIPYFLMMLTDAFMKVRRYIPIECVSGKCRENRQEVCFCLCLKCAPPDMCPRAALHNQVFSEKDSESLRVHPHTNFLGVVNARSDSLAHCPRVAMNVLENPAYTKTKNALDVLEF